MQWANTCPAVPAISAREKVGFRISLLDGKRKNETAKDKSDVLMKLKAKNDKVTSVLLRSFVNVSDGATNAESIRLATKKDQTKTT